MLRNPFLISLAELFPWDIDDGSGVPTPKLNHHSLQNCDERGLHLVLARGVCPVPELFGLCWAVVACPGPFGLCWAVVACPWRFGPRWEVFECRRRFTLLRRSELPRRYVPDASSCPSRWHEMTRDSISSEARDFPAAHCPHSAVRSAIPGRSDHEPHLCPMPERPPFPQLQM